MSLIKLHYLDIYARAECIRLLLTHAKVPFEDIRYKFEDFPKLKQSGNLEFGQLPVLEVDGKFFP
jgi:prostaglandin-H2 D-isomerase / glutathione transferase